MNRHSQSAFIVSQESLMTNRGNRHPAFALTLSSLGFNVEYLTTNYNHAEKKKFTPQEITDFVKLVPYKAKVFSMTAYPKNICFRRLFGNIKTASLMAFYILKNCRRNDIIIVNSQPPEFILIAALAKKLRRNKLIVDVRDVWPDGLPLTNRFTHKLFRAYCLKICSIAMKEADYCIYTASGFLQWLKRYVKHNNIDFIPLGFDKNRWTNYRPLRSQDINQTIKFAYIGDINKSAKIEPLIHSIAGSSRYSLTFIGKGDSLDVIKKLSEKLNAQNIHFTGFLPKEKVAEEIQNFHVTVIPLKIKYAMPNKLFDSIASFRPILVFGQNDTAEFVKNHDIGWNLPFDIKKIKSFLHSLNKENIAAKSQNIAKIRNEFSEQFLYAKAVRKILELSKNHLPDKN